MSYVAWLALVSAVFVVAERLAPRRPDAGPLRPGIATDLVYVVLNGHFIGMAVAVGAVPLARFARRFAAPLGAGFTPVGLGWSFATQLVVAFFALDLLKWLIHNLLHRVPSLWRIHQVHHSIERMDWAGSMRFHFGEVLIYDALLYVPLALLGLRGDVLFVLAVAGTAIGHFNHANLRLSIGPLRYLVNSPEMHVWHHAHPDAGPVNRNFGVNLSLWDWLFGTAFLPGDGRAPARLGFEGIEVFPNDPLRQALWPLRRRRPRGPIASDDSGASIRTA